MMILRFLRKERAFRGYAETYKVEIITIII